MISTLPPIPYVHLALPDGRAAVRSRCEALATFTKTASEFDAFKSHELPGGVLISEEGHIEHSEWLEKVINEIESFSSRSSNWDSYGADAPQRRLLESAKSLICCLWAAGVYLEPNVCPTRQGGVQFDWEVDSRYFEIEVVGECAATFHYSDSDERIMISGEIFKGERLNELLSYIRLVEQVQ